MCLSDIRFKRNLSTAGSDYFAVVNQVLMFSSTSPQRQCTTVAIINDNTLEPVQQFFIQINQDPNTEAVVSIEDNDGTTTYVGMEVRV